MVETEGFAPRKVEIFSAGCPICTTAVNTVREVIDPRHDIAIQDLQHDERAVQRASALGIHTVPAVVVDGALLGCCDNEGPTPQSLLAAGLG